MFKLLLVSHHIAFSSVQSIVSSYTISYVSAHTDINTVTIIDQSQAADLRLEKMMNGDIQEVAEDDRQVHKICNFQPENCGTVYVDSLNTASATMENCGNHVPQVTCSSHFCPQ